MKLAQVGSSIHGTLLAPNDVDIAIQTDSKKEFKQLCKLYNSEPVHIKGKSLATSKQGSFNYIILHNITISEYVKGMDFNIVRGYKNLQSGRLVLFKEAKQALKTKTIKMLHRDKIHSELFAVYGSTDSERLGKYLQKLPTGWTLTVSK